MRLTLLAFLLLVVGTSTTAHARNSEQQIVYPLDGDFEFVSGIGEPRKGHKHQGVDLGAAKGTPIVAIWDAVVTKTGRSGRAGWSVWLLHSNGVSSFYAHMKSKPIVVTGQEVHQGEVLGYVGETGNATFPHLHFEMHLDGKVLNPLNVYGKL